MKFRKRPVVVDAVQWTGDNPTTLIEWLSGFNAHVRPPSAALEASGEVACARCVATFDYTTEPPGFSIRTLEGEMRADPGDWIIRGVKGEFYPCKPDTFAATYEEVEVTA